MKRILQFALVLALALIVTGVRSGNQTLSAQEEEEGLIRVTETRSVLLVDVDEEVDMTNVEIEGPFGTIRMHEATLTTVADELDIADETLIVRDEGAFSVNVIHDNRQLTVTIIAKTADADEYVLYEEDFSGMADGPLPGGYQRVTGAAAIKDERLWLSASSSTAIVLFPSYLESFSNYIIETDFTIDEADNASRWASVMFRYSTENYFQMAIRKDATAHNGVEFAKRIDGSWNVPATTSFDEELDGDKMYRLKIDVFGTTVVESIDGQEMITYENALEFNRGRIGVQANGSDAYYDNIRITLPVDYIVEEQHEFTAVPDIYEVDTGLVAPPTVVSRVEDADHLDRMLGETRPATAVFTLDEDGNVVDTDGEVMMSPFEALVAVDGKLIPAFHTNEIEVAEELAESFRFHRIRDVFLFSDEPEVILAARDTFDLIRGVLVFDFDTGVDHLTTDDLLEIRKETNRAQATVALLPARLLDQETFRYLHKRVMSVWALTDEDDPISQHQAILSGAHGIVTGDFTAAFDILATFPENAYTRRPLVIGHRGLPTLGPENSIESALLAVEKGADIVEMDVHMTLNLEIVLMHDASTNRTTDGNHVIANTPLEVLRELTLNCPVGEYENARIPTLQEYFEALQETDAPIFIDIKTNDELPLELMVDIIEEYDIYDQSAFIAFGAHNIEYLNEIYPEVANGYLNSGLVSSGNLDVSIMNVLTTVVPMNATYNPQFSGVRDDLTDALRHRGITTWPWTINNEAQVYQYYLYGVDGITTDYTHHLSDTWNRLIFADTTFTYTLTEDADTMTIPAYIGTPRGDTYRYHPAFELVNDGGTGITIDEKGRITGAENEGTAHVMATFASNLPDGTPIHVVNDLITIEVREPSGFGALVIGLVTGAVVLTAGFAGAMFFIKRK